MGLRLQEKKKLRFFVVVVVIIVVLFCFLKTMKVAKGMEDGKEDSQVSTSALSDEVTVRKLWVE